MNTPVTATTATTPSSGDDYRLFDIFAHTYPPFDNGINDSIIQGTKHKYASSVSTQSTTQSRKPPAPKKRRDQKHTTPLINDDSVSVSAFISDRSPGGYDTNTAAASRYQTYTKHEEHVLLQQQQQERHQQQQQQQQQGITFSPSSFQDSGVSSPDDINDWLRQDEEENVLKIMSLQRQLADLQQVLSERDEELELYRQYMHFPIPFIKERARQSFEQHKREAKQLDELTVDTILESLLHSPSKPSENLSLPFAIGLFQQEWIKRLGKKSSHRDLKKKENRLVEKESKSKQDTQSIVTWEKHSNFGSAIYISASSTATSSNRSFMAMSTTTGSRIQMIAGTLNQKVDRDARQTLFDQYINGTISQQSPSYSASSCMLANSSNPNNSDHTDDITNSSPNAKLTESESLAVKETAKQCFMSFDGKMIIENESERLEYLQEHCHALTPSSLTLAVDYFKQELEKVRNKTKKQLLRFQNYNTDKWDQPIEKVCYMILGKSRWEKLTDREKTLITGKYAYLRMRLEDLKKRNAKIKWDKLQDEFERHVKSYEQDWETLCLYWLSLDQGRYKQRKEWESAQALSHTASSHYSRPFASQSMDYTNNTTVTNSGDVTDTSSSDATNTTPSPITENAAVSIVHVSSSAAAAGTPSIQDQNDILFLHQQQHRNLSLNQSLTPHHHHQQQLRLHHLTPLDSYLP